jgi:diaminopimelate decarboxylase
MQAEQFERPEIRNLVLSILNRSEIFIQTVQEWGTPLYIYEPGKFETKARTFVEAFTSHLNVFEAFFALKCNNHPEVAAAAVMAGLGLDVSSGIELELALKTGCKRILFSGPGKTKQELDLAAAHPERVTVLMDSFGELENLDLAASRTGSSVTAGVRLTTNEEGLWRKFGIPQSSLNCFLKAAAGKKGVDLKGLQFHTSWNMDPWSQVKFITQLGRTLASADPSLVRTLHFLDIGGGYWPGTGEWILDGDSGTGFPGDLLKTRRCIPAARIEDFAREISRALKEHIFTLAPLAVYAEPGRWIADETMHIAISVVDRKSSDIVITDAGTNIVGWEKYETDFVPVINLSRPSLTERPCLIAGSLCTPHDVWGWSYFGDGIEPGDILLLPNQGAYAWSLRQEFIKPIARVAQIRDNGSRIGSPDNGVLEIT